MEEIGLLVVKLVVGLVGVFSQLELLSTGTILEPKADKTV